MVVILHRMRFAAITFLNSTYEIVFIFLLIHRSQCYRKSSLCLLDLQCLLKIELTEIQVDMNQSSNQLGKMLNSCLHGYWLIEYVFSNQLVDKLSYKNTLYKVL